MQPDLNPPPIRGILVFSRPHLTSVGDFLDSCHHIYIQILIVNIAGFTSGHATLGGQTILLLVGPSRPGSSDG